MHIMSEFQGHVQLETLGASLERGKGTKFSVLE